MKSLALTLALFLSSTLILKAQSCDEVMSWVKSSSYGQTYSSYSSDAISRVTFYTVTADYQTYYFAIVCFKSPRSYGCREYIYQVDSNTQYNYSSSYYTSAGKAFWNYIEPYSGNLGCGPSF